MPEKVFVTLLVGLSVVMVFYEKESFSQEPASVSAPVLTTSEIPSNEIKQLVKDLEYPDEVAQDFVLLVSHWQNARGRSILGVLKHALQQAQQHAQQGKASKDTFARAEQDIATQLLGSIIEEIPTFDEAFYELPDVIKHKRTQCLGYTQLFYILGNSVGLSVKAVNVEVDFRFQASEFGKGKGHIACVVQLANNKLLMVDLAQRPTPLISTPFLLETEYRQIAHYWEFTGRDNALRSYARIQILDSAAITAALYYDRGVHCIGSGRLTEAISAFSRSIERDPQHVLAYNNRGTAYIGLGKYTEALSDLNKAIEYNPEYAIAYVNRGMAYGSIGKFSEALSDLNRVIELDPGCSQAYNNRGSAYLKLEKYTKALSDYSKAIELDAQYATAYNNRGTAYMRLGKFKEALSDYSKAIELDPQYATAYDNRGNAYLKLNKLADAGHDFDKAGKLDPKYTNRTFTMTTKLGTNKAALLDLIKRSKLTSESDSAYFTRANSYYGLGKYNEALSDYSKAIELNPESAGVYYSRGNAYLSLGKPTEALSDYSKAIELNPTFPAAHNNRGFAYRKLGKYTEAISDHNKAINLNPKFAEAYYNRGLVYVAMGRRTTEALSDYSKAIELNPKYEEAYFCRGIIYAVNGKSEAAKKDLLKVVELNPARKPSVKKISDEYKLDP